MKLNYRSNSLFTRINNLVWPIVVVVVVVAAAAAVVVVVVAIAVVAPLVVASSLRRRKVIKLRRGKTHFIPLLYLLDDEIHFFLFISNLTQFEPSKLLKNFYCSPLFNITIDHCILLLFSKNLSPGCL